MGKKAVNQPCKNITNIHHKNKWRVGDCSICGKANIRSSKWKNHQNHEENELKILIENRHKLVAESFGNMFKKLVKRSVYAHLVEKHEEELNPQEYLHLYGKIQFGILAAISGDPQFQQIYERAQEENDSIAAFTTK